VVEVDCAWKWKWKPEHELGGELKRVMMKVMKVVLQKVEFGVKKIKIDDSSPW
jgi:hypothetical protein